MAEVSVCCRSITAIAGSNSAEGMDVHLCVNCVLCRRRRADRSSRGVL